MNRLISAFILLTTLLSYVNVQAESEKEQRYYDVEMIFFRHLGAIDPNEQWPAGYFPVETDTALELHWEKKQGGFIGLPESSYQLTKEANHLKWSKRYQLLQHLAWRQPGLPEKEAVAIHIRAGKPLGLRPEVMPSEQNGAIPSFNSTSLNNRRIGQSNEEQLKGQLVYPLEGTITVVLKRYLHLYTHLSFTQREQVPVVTPEPIGKTATEQNSAEPTTADTQVTPLAEASSQQPRFYFQSYPVQGHRKMRSKEVHYLDNPRIGVIVLMTPVKTP